MSDREYRIRFDRTDDGRFRAHCDEVAGFYLANTDADKVARDALTVLKTLLRHNHGMDVDIVELLVKVLQK